MISIETIRIKIRRYYMKKTVKLRKNKIKCNDFTIISNNCWGGFVYQSYRIIKNKSYLLLINYIIVLIIPFTYNGIAETVGLFIVAVFMIFVFLAINQVINTNKIDKVS